MIFYFKFSEDDKTFNLSMEHERLNQINVLLKTRYRSRIAPHGVRSKYVCIPNKVIQAGNHFLNEPPSISFFRFLTNVFTTFTAKTPDAGLFAESTIAQSPAAKIPEKLFNCKFRFMIILP